MAKALEDIKVLEVSQYESASTAGEMMAFLGAEVVKVEPPGKGDPARYASPGAPKDADSMYFIYLNLNKKSITLDLTKPRGVEIFKDMARNVDVVLENLGPGVMAGMGLGCDVLRELNPRLIYASITPFGCGPYENYPGTDLIAQAMAGAMDNTGFPDKPPVRPGPQVGETGSGVYMFGAIMAALHQRERTGKGQFVETAIADAVLNNMRVPLTISQTGRDQMYQGLAGMKRTGGMTQPYRTMDSDTNDTYVIILATAPHMQDNLLKVIGREGFLAEERKAAGPIALLLDPKLSVPWNEAIEAWTKSRNDYEAFHTIAKAKVPVGLTLNTTQIMNDPHYVTRKTVVQVAHPVRGEFKTPTTPHKLEKSPVEVKCAPLLGQDNEEVYAKLAGFTKEDLAKLKAIGVV